MKNKTVIVLVMGILFLAAFNAGLNAQDRSFTSIRLQPTIAYLKYHDKECRMARLVFEGGKNYNETTIIISFNGLRDQQVIPASGEGRESYEVALPGPVTDKDMQATLTLVMGQQTFTARCIVSPARKWNMYVLAHSHVDVGYTNTQEKVLKLHINNINEAIALAGKTQHYPSEARYKWNTEAMWVVDNYLATAGETKKKAFWEAVKNGWICIDGAYGNINTSATDSRQLMQMFYDATSMAKKQGIEINTMFQGDVPGSSWGLAAQAAQTGIRYFLSGPNSSDRIGYLARWQDKPFYLLSPSGKQKLLFWQCQPYSLGYALKGSKIPNFFTIADPKPFYTGHPSENFLNPSVFEYLAGLENSRFPYDMTILTWAMSDNAPIDPELPDAVKAWNERYASPRLVITSTKQFFNDFEQKYKDKIPEIAGDYTEYWTDGLGSAARETAINRNASEKLQQADAILAIRGKVPYPYKEVQTAWKNLLMFNEHTWGAYNSVDNPDDPKVKSEWNVKQSFALNAQKDAGTLMAQALEASQGSLNVLDVYNTASWKRTDVVYVPAALSSGGSRIINAAGDPVPSQRLTTGELVFIAADVPPTGKSRYRVIKGDPYNKGTGSISGNELNNGIYKIKINPVTGTVSSLVQLSTGIDVSDAGGLNEYLYMPGDSLSKIVSSENVRITVKEKGPLVVSLLIEADAPGTKAFSTEVRLVYNIDRVEIINTIDKMAIRNKESVHFKFPFKVADAHVRYNIPWGAVQLETDQLPYANRNWHTVQRWVDVSNAEYGVTWSTPDAPLLEIGKIRTEGLLGGLEHSALWTDRVFPSPHLYSWVMNNLWHTNFRAEQEGIVTFRYYINVHGRFNNFAVNRVGLDNHRPLIVAAADNSTAKGSLFTIDGKDVYAESIKPANDGNGVIVQLINCGENDSRVTLNAKHAATQKIWESNLLEEQTRRLDNGFMIPAKGILTVKVQ